MMVSPPDARNILGHVPGRICVAPTDMTAAYPHGGVDLGEVGLVQWGSYAPLKMITYEEWGVEVVNAMSQGEAVSLAFTLRELNVRAYQEVFLNSTAGSVTGHATVSGPSTNGPGYFYADRAKVFAFSPINTDNHPCVVFHKGIPAPAQSFDVSLSDAETARWGVPCVIFAARNGSGDAYFVGRAADVTL